LLTAAIVEELELQLLDDSSR